LDKIILYHGSSYDFYTIDLQQGRPYKDFGQGFYATANINHAKSMAERNAQMRVSKLKRHNTEQNIINKWLYQYIYDTNNAENLEIKIFAEADREWGRFITLNRRSRVIAHQFDIVIGPTANDFTNPTIQFYMSGGLGEVGSDNALDELVRLLLPYKLPSQYYFATKKSIQTLSLIRKERL